MKNNPGELFGPDDVLERATAWAAEGKGVAIATVVATWGSSPRPAGSQMAISAEGEFFGSVSGGCIEGAVITEAAEIVASGAPKIFDYGVTDDRAWEVGLACGGTVRVLVERLGAAPGLSRDLVAGLTEARAAKRPAALVTEISSGRHALLGPDTVTGELRLDAATLVDARATLKRNRNRLIDAPGGEIFVHAFNPPLRLTIIGAVHIAQPLVPMARLAGYEITVIDPRRAFATPERLPGVTLSTDWPDKALTALPLDEQSALIALTHDPKLDDPALVAALRSGAFYIGALGSRRTHAKRLDRLAGHGFDEATLARIHGPIGLDIGAVSPAEIAIAILAEITQIRRQGPGT